MKALCLGKREGLGDLVSAPKPAAVVALGNSDTLPELLWGSDGNRPFLTPSQPVHTCRVSPWEGCWGYSKEQSPSKGLTIQGVREVSKPLREHMRESGGHTALNGIRRSREMSAKCKHPSETCRMNQELPRWDYLWLHGLVSDETNENEFRLHVSKLKVFTALWHSPKSFTKDFSLVTLCRE